MNSVPEEAPLPYGEVMAGDDAVVDDSKKIAATPTRFQVKAFSNFLASNVTVQSLYGAAVGFTLYFAMYGIRKPFKAATFVDENGEKLLWFGTSMTLKTTLILFQLMGYLTSKFIGIKVTSEAKGKQDYILAALCLFAQGSLVLFGIIGTYAPNWSFIPIFFNGLPLGMVWGLVVSYFEGRKGSDFMMVSLCISFIVGSGVVKDIALVLLDRGFTQYWVPAIEGAMFACVWFLCIILLNQLPPPSTADIELRGERVAMNHQKRLAYFLLFAPGLVALWVGAALLTSYRDYRDSFSVEIIEDMGVEVVPGILSKTESIIAGVLLIPIASLVFVKDNKKSFAIAMSFLVLGAIILLVSTTLYMAAPYDGVKYYIISGLGSYLGYVPYNSVLFERLIGALGEQCTVSYLMSVMDALGYLGVFAVFLVAEFAPAFDNYLVTYNILGQVFGWAMLGLYIFAAFYFSIKLRHDLSDNLEMASDMKEDPMKKAEKTERLEEQDSFQKSQQTESATSVLDPGYASFVNKLK